jgi:phosphopantetheinyl transferase
VIALAADGARYRGCGIDVERLPSRPRVPGEAAFEAEEIALLDRWPPGERGLWEVRMWCAKEAVGKALGIGVEGDPRSLRVEAVDPTGVVGVRAVAEPLVLARTTVGAGLVMAAALVPAPI